MEGLLTWVQMMEWWQIALDRVLQWALGALNRAHDVAQQFGALPADVLVIVAAYCSFVALVGLVGWARSTARHKQTTRVLADAKRQQADLQVKYDAEVKWRIAADRFASRHVDP